MFPRPLNGKEKEFLEFILPENKEVYKKFYDRLKSMSVIGQGRFGEGNFYLGFPDDKPDFSYPSLMVFAAGQQISDDAVIQITIHEEYDNKIEFSVNNVLGENIPDNFTPKKKWTYSSWNAGDPSPFENDNLRQIDVGGQFLIVISAANKSIWVHEMNSHYNHIIPVSNFLNELLRGNKEIDRTQGINMNYIIDNNEKFEDRDYIDTLIQYNKQWRRLDLSIVDEKKLPKKKKDWPSASGKN